MTGQVYGDAFGQGGEAGGHPAGGCRSPKNLGFTVPSPLAGCRATQTGKSLEWSDSSGAGPEGRKVPAGGGVCPKQHPLIRCVAPQTYAATKFLSTYCRMPPLR